MNKKNFLTTLPDFTEIQQASFCWFLSKGLIKEFEKISFFTNLSKSIELYFFGQQYKIKIPKYTQLESKYRGINYNLKIYIPVSVTYYNHNLLRKNSISLNYYFIGELPLLTNRGTFIINGWERVVVSQIIRCPGVYYQKKISNNNQLVYIATLIPNQGSWLKFQLIKKNINICIDKKIKISIREFFDIYGIKSSQIIKYVEYPPFIKKFYLGKSKELSTKKHNIRKAKILQFKTIFNKKVLNSEYYSLGKQGRYQINKKFNLNISKNIEILKMQDIISIVDGLLECSSKKTDDIDHLKNKIIRSVGELLVIQYRCGLSKFRRGLMKKFDVGGMITFISQKFLKFEFLTRVIREFFNSSELSQFLDQTNPLSELTHRRKISGFGPGGFTNKRISVKLRDVHPSYYGRMCPIETSEGEKAGLVSSLSIYARINSFGFIETPFFKVKKGIILNSDRTIYLTAEEEDQFKIAPADSATNKIGKILTKFTIVKYNQEFIKILSTDIEFISVSPIQIFAAATSLIPFLEHNDASRTLMGANMQRQAIPLLYPTKPIIGTGFENQLVMEAGMSVICYRDGYVKQILNNSIFVKNNNNTEIVYSLIKYSRSNQNICINNRSIVWSGENIQTGQIIADGSGTEGTEMSLGQNILIAYMPWEGYNYEDALLISERLLYADLFTSVHIEQYILYVKKTPFGQEKLTKQLPFISETITKKLDDNGIIIIGKFVEEGDILVGKITPKKILFDASIDNDIFNRQSCSLVDNSLRVPIGSHGRILDIRIFSTGLPENFVCSIRIFLAQIKKLQIGDKMAGRHGNKGVISKILKREDMPYLPNGKSIDIILNPLGVPSRMNIGQLFEGLFGLSADSLDKRFKILPFDEMFKMEASRLLVNHSLKLAKFYSKNKWMYNNVFPGKILLKDGRTGNTFENPITICKSYIFKLAHLVEDKIHARGIGPYSLITQQPLGGKSSQGGQRFGEMEVWALEAFGTAYTLQELLTIKSDNENSKIKTFNAIIHGESIPQSRIPEAFKLLIFELRALGLDISVHKLKKNKDLGLKAVDIKIVENFNKRLSRPIYKSIETN